MAQAAFDHWFNMHANVAYTDRCRQKKKLRQRKPSGGNYQVGEDVWARHPDGNIMYVASVMAVNNYKRTYNVIFNNGQMFDLPISHLRHVTLEDIQCDRYVDYGEGWSERTDIGAINIYDRYGELQETHFTGESEDIYNELFTDQDHNCVNEHIPDNVPSLNNTAEDKVYIYGSSNSLITEIFVIPIPDPEEPTATYCRCPVWDVSSYAEAEAKAMKLINLDFDYLKAVERAKHRKETSQQHRSLHSFEVNTPQSNETLAQMEFHLTECGSQSLFLESSILMCESSTGLAHKQPSTENMNESEDIILSDQQGINPQLAEHESSTNQSLSVVVDRTDVQDLPTVKEVGTQTESSGYLSTITINLKQELIARVYPNQPVQGVPFLAIFKKKTSRTWPKYHWQIRNNVSMTTTYLIDKQHKFWSRLRLSNTSNYVFTKFLSSTLLIAMIIFQLSTGSIINERDVNGVPLKIRRIISTDIIYINAIPILIAAIISFSSILNGLSRSMFELWFYPFTVP